MFLIVVTPLVVAGFVTVKRAIPESTCFDNRKNQNETGVDCGGLCLSCELTYPQPIKVFWARAVPVRENSYDVAAQIQNSNELVSSVDVEYEFTLYDDFGPLITRTGKTFLYAQERTLVIEQNIETVRLATRTEFRISHVVWQEKRDLIPTIIAERRVYSIAEDRGRKQGVVDITLFNKSPYDFAQADVQIAVLDKEGNLLGVNKIQVEHILSQSRLMLKAIWPQIFTGDVAIINIEPRVNIFDPHTILKPQ